MYERLPEEIRALEAQSGQYKETFGRLFTIKESQLQEFVHNILGEPEHRGSGDRLARLGMLKLGLSIGSKSHHVVAELGFDLGVVVSEKISSKTENPIMATKLFETWKDAHNDYWSVAANSNVGKDQLVVFWNGHDEVAFLGSGEDWLCTLGGISTKTIGLRGERTTTLGGVADREFSWVTHKQPGLDAYVNHRNGEVLAAQKRSQQNAYIDNFGSELAQRMAADKAWIA